jgi:phosphate:Na+ symporter
MTYTLFDVLSLLGSLGFFIYGMKVMSEGIQKIAGARMRNILESMTSNRLKGVFTGFFLTALVQSSSATTVMVVSFVNAGLLSLTESIGVIMGANIGTTITAWIISLFGFSFNISSYALPVIAVGVPLLFAVGSRKKAWGESLVGFALVFMGLAALKETVPDLESNHEILAFLQSYTNLGYLSVLLFVIIGTVITIIVQSSSAAMAVTLVMANQGWIPFELAAAMVLGENIGTTITANLAAIVANVHAKRSARAHFVFNVAGVIWMLIVFIPVIRLISAYMVSTLGVSPAIEASAIPIGLSIFHTVFNITNTLLLVGFTQKIADLVTKMVPSKGDDEEFHLEFLARNILPTPEISIMEARKELAKFANVTIKMSDFTHKLLAKKDSKSHKKMMDKIKKYEALTDQMEVEISTFLSKVAEGNISEDSSRKIRSLLSNANDLERIGDLFYQISMVIERQLERGHWFQKDQLRNLNRIFTMLDESLHIMQENLSSQTDNINLNEAMAKEREINALRNELRRDYLKKVENGEFDVKESMRYIELINSCEKVADHVINISESLSGQVVSK